MDSSPSPENKVSTESCCCGCGTDDRREFVGKLAIGLGAAAAYAVPALGGIVALLNPLRLKGTGGEFLRVAALDTLPTDGTPRKFPVVAERVDG